jgi:hypothetical protein
LGIVDPARPARLVRCRETVQEALNPLSSHSIWNRSLFWTLEKENKFQK